MNIKFALAGNPNCGKTTMFNALTGANQYVGNWPGVTVEKKEAWQYSENSQRFPRALCSVSFPLCGEKQAAPVGDTSHRCCLLIATFL